MFIGHERGNFTEANGSAFAPDIIRKVFFDNGI